LSQIKLVYPSFISKIEVTPKNLEFILKSFICIFLLSATFIYAENDYQPMLFKSISLIYEDDFKKDGPFNKDHWEVRQSTTWIQKNGVLHGSQSSKEFQKKKLASSDPTHAGFRPVIFLKPVPEEFVVQLRIRYIGEYKRKNQTPLMDLGHHLQSFCFGRDTTRLILHKNKKLNLTETGFEIGKWMEITAEIKKGEMVFIINGNKHIYKDPLVDLKESLQIDFKGLDFGTIEIDWVKLYQGNL
jgi:hypothetical protein